MRLIKKVLLLVLLFWMCTLWDNNTKKVNANIINLSDTVITDFSFSKFDIYDSLNNLYTPGYANLSYIVNEVSFEATGFYINIVMNKSTNLVYYKENSGEYVLLEQNVNSKVFLFNNNSKSILIKIVDGSDFIEYNLSVNKEKLSSDSRIDKSTFKVKDQYQNFIEEGYWKEFEYIIPAFAIANNVNYVFAFITPMDENAVIFVNNTVLKDNATQALYLEGTTTTFEIEVYSEDSSTKCLYLLTIHKNPPEVDTTLFIDAVDNKLLNAKFEEVSFDINTYFYNIYIEEDVLEVEFLVTYNDIFFIISGGGVYETVDEVTFVTISITSFNSTITDYTFIITKEITSNEFQINDVSLKTINLLGEKEVLTSFVEDFDPSITTYGPYQISSDVLNLNVIFNCVNYDSINYYGTTLLKTGLNVVSVKIIYNETELNYFIYLIKDYEEFEINTEVDDLDIEVSNNTITLKLTKQKPTEIDYKKLINASSFTSVKVLTDVKVYTREVLLEVSCESNTKIIKVVLVYEDILYDNYYKLYGINIISIISLTGLLLITILIKGKKIYQKPSRKRRLKK